MADGRSTLVSVDLDDLDCYAAIHGLGPVDAAARRWPLERWVPRMLDFFERRSARVTLFVVGRDLARDLDGKGRGAQWIGQAARSGHELANHSFAHAYDMVHRGAKWIRADLGRCDALLREFGPAPVGFRAPGYTHDAALLREVAALGYRYDSSRLPSPPYYLAKLAAIGWSRLRGRRSASQVGGWATFLGRPTPHYLDAIDLWEFPVSVASGLRLPLVGTALWVAPSWLFRRLCAATATMEHVHLELHAIDFADASRDALPSALLRTQPGLESPLNRRLDRLARILDERPLAAPIRSAVSPR